MSLLFIHRIKYLLRIDVELRKVSIIIKRELCTKRTLLKYLKILLNIKLKIIMLNYLNILNKLDATNIRE